MNKAQDSGNGLFNLQLTNNLMKTNDVIKIQQRSNHHLVYIEKKNSKIFISMNNVINYKQCKTSNNNKNTQQ